MIISSLCVCVARAASGYAIHENYKNCWEESYWRPNIFTGIHPDSRSKMR